MTRTVITMFALLAMSTPATSCPWDFAQFYWLTNNCCVKILSDTGSTTTDTSGCSPCEVDIVLDLDSGGAQPGCRVRSYAGIGNPAWSTGTPTSIAVAGVVPCGSAQRVQIQTDSNNDNVADCAIYEFYGICASCGS